ncbi:hypothetical protein B484DRAFT_390596, partial [Ochromonadaceae sp. CCMP2298]
MDVDAEQRFHDLEQRYLALKKEYDIVVVDKDSHDSKTASLQSFLDQNAVQLSTLESKANQCAAELAQRDRVVGDLTAANDDLNDRVRRRSDECDRLRDELKSQSAELVLLQARLRDATASLGDLQTTQLPTQYELTKTLHEKDLIAQQARYLEGELQRKAAEEQSLRAESGEQIHSLEVKLSSASAASEEAAVLVATLRGQAVLMEEKTASYVEALSTAEGALVQKTGAFTQEVESLKRLVELYKRYFEEATGKIEALEQHEALMKEAHGNVLKGLREKVSQMDQLQEAAAGRERAQ